MLRRTNSDPLVKGTRLYYDTKENLWLAMAEQWQVDANRNVIPNTCQRTSVMEYRYDNARARYMTRPRNPQTFLPQGGTASGNWHDFDGADIWNDYTMTLAGSVPTVANPPAIGTLLYSHADHLGSTRLMTGPGGEIVGRFVYTAFGEVVLAEGAEADTPAPPTRYRYGGDWGYETTANTSYLHVGYRWYDPSTGRFLQRDPIGIAGGANTYAYVGNNPLIFVDPFGLADLEWSWRDFSGWVGAGAGTGAALGGTTTGGPGAGPGAASGAAAGAIGYTCQQLSFFAYDNIVEWWKKPPAPPPASPPFVPPLPRQCSACGGPIRGDSGGHFHGPRR